MTSQFEKQTQLDSKREDLIATVAGCKRDHIFIIFFPVFPLCDQSPQYFNTVSMCCVCPSNWRDSHSIMTEINKYIDVFPILKSISIGFFASLYPFYYYYFGSLIKRKHKKHKNTKTQKTKKKPTNI